MTKFKLTRLTGGYLQLLVNDASDSWAFYITDGELDQLMMEIITLVENEPEQELQFAEAA